MSTEVRHYSVPELGYIGTLPSFPPFNGQLVRYLREETANLKRAALRVSELPGNNAHACLTAGLDYYCTKKVIDAIRMICPEFREDEYLVREECLTTHNYLSDDPRDTVWEYAEAPTEEYGDGEITDNQEEVTAVYEGGFRWAYL